MRMTLVRHGESVANTKGILQGHMDSPLSEMGQKQAEELGHRLLAEGYHFDRIYSSDLSRAAETVRIIGKVLNFKEIVYTSQLRELDLGIFSGCKMDEEPPEVRQSLNTFWADYSKKIPEGESVDSMIHRHRSFLEMIENQEPQPKSILVVCHGGSLYHILHTILDVFKPDDEWFGNCRVNEIVRTSKSSKWRLVKFNGEKIP